MEFIIPKCDRCGVELTKKMIFKEGSQTKQNPYGEKIRWWECPCCRMKKEI